MHDRYLLLSDPRPGTLGSLSQLTACLALQLGLSWALPSPAAICKSFCSSCQRALGRAQEAADLGLYQLAIFRQCPSTTQPPPWVTHSRCGLVGHQSPTEAHSPTESFSVVLVPAQQLLCYSCSQSSKPTQPTGKSPHWHTNSNQGSAIRYTQEGTHSQHTVH